MLEGGLHGIYAVLEQQQAARRWTLPLDRLGDEIDRVVIWDVDLLDDGEMADLVDWVEAGHTAVVGGNLAPLEAGFSEGDQETGLPVAAHPAHLGVREVSVGTLRFISGHEGNLIHLKDANGEPVLISWSVGQGRIYWSADTEWLSNKRIAQGQNLELALNILLPAQGKQVAFDEYHHGFQSASRWWQILRGPLKAFVALLAVVTAVLFWAYGARFGSPRPTPPGPPRAAVEYVYSMSQLYRRSQARGVVLQALYRSLLVELGRLLGGTRGLTHHQIAERTAHRAGVKPEALKSLLDRIAPDQQGVPSEADLIKLARETEELQRRMHNAGYRDQRDAPKGSR